MKNNNFEKNLERARINLYNILAILIVIIPEHFAEFIYTIEASQHKTILANEGDAWESDIELKLSKMNIFELRLIAKRLSLHKETHPKELIEPSGLEPLPPCMPWRRAFSEKLFCFSPRSINNSSYKFS